MGRYSDNHDKYRALLRGRSEPNPVSPPQGPDVKTDTVCLCCKSECYALKKGKYRPVPLAAPSQSKYLHISLTTTT